MDKADADLICSFAELTALLAQDGVVHQLQPRENAVHVQLETDDVLTLWWREQLGLLEYSLSTDRYWPDSDSDKIWRTLGTLNHIAPMPCLTYNETTQKITYRFVVPILPRGGFTPIELRSMFSLTRSTARLMFERLGQSLSHSPA